MRTAGIIAEYNPFHSGHKYHIEETRRRTGADYIVAVMSGDFVQRGEPAVCDKYLRAHMALLGGADVVVELPTAYATASAEYFASAGAALLETLGCVDFLSFGSEEASLEELSETAALLLEESPAFREALRRELGQGTPFPAARSRALLAASGKCGEAGERLCRLLAAPNHILGIEYLKALFRLHSSIAPVAVRREGLGYHDLDAPDVSRHPSAAAVRRRLADGDWDGVRAGVPYRAGELIDAWRGSDFLSWEDMTAYLSERIFWEPGALSGVFGVDGDLARRMVSRYPYGKDFSGVLEALHARNRTDAALRRALLHIVLHIGKELLPARAAEAAVPYARILGFRENASPLLKRMRETARIPLVQRPAQGRRLLGEEGPGAALYQKDIQAADYYERVAAGKCGRTPVRELRRGPVILREEEK